MPSRTSAINSAQEDLILLDSDSEIPNPYCRNGVTLFCDDVLNLYERWEPPVVIVSDGAYGLGQFEGDPSTPEQLPEWYEPHVVEWSCRATPQTTLWFWNTEIGWVNVHPVLVRHGWRYVNCHIWDKGLSHVAGNSNTQVLRKFPVVTEVCVQYVRDVRIGSRTLEEWLRHEWERSGLPLSLANKACGVQNAATRKYLSRDTLWYFPSPEMFARLVEFANRYGKPEGIPYFSLDGQRPLTREEWAGMRAKFYCRVGVTNVWRLPPLNGKERVRLNNKKSLHPNQKPLELIQLIIESSSDVGDMVWEPFGGLCTTALACLRLGRRCRSAEKDMRFYERAVRRLQHG